jgi:DNA-binding transcriptional LysR family regulator
MDFRRQKYFMAVAENLGFRRAANALHISQPSLSLQIQLLEEDLGVLLFERKSRSIKLTAAGQEYFKAVQSAMDELERGTKRAHDAQAGNLGALTVGTNAISLIDTLPPIVSLFRNQYPDVSLRVSVIPGAKLLEALLERRVDVALTVRLGSDDEEIETQVVRSLDLRVVLHESDPHVGHAEVALHELTGQAMFVPAYYQNLIGFENVVEICRSHHLRPSEIHQIGGDHASISIMGLVSCGLGFGIVGSGNEAIKIPSIVFKPIAGVHQHTVELKACWRRNDSNLLINKFRELLQCATSPLPSSTASRS